MGVTRKFYEKIEVKKISWTHSEEREIERLDTDNTEALV